MGIRTKHSKSNIAQYKRRREDLNTSSLVLFIKETCLA